MNRYYTRVTLLIIAFAGFMQGKEQPNIIYINADDLGVMDVGYQSERYHTPNIDKLRASGMLFTEGYAPAANCAPSRACVMSGQVGARHGVYTVGSSERGAAAFRKLIPTKNTELLKLENLILPVVLHEAGYRTIHLGKWHVGKDPLQQGFDVNIGGDKSGSPHGGYFVPFKSGSMKPFNNEYAKGTHRVDIFADQAIRFLRESQDKPFFMHMAYYSVHTPLAPVPELVGKYKGKVVNATYASMIEKMDEGIGKILDEVDALGLRENTLIIFSSDNGGLRKFSSQEPYRSGKGSYFEGGIRVPVVVNWKGTIEPGSACEVPVSGIDFFPTILAAAGLAVPDGKMLDVESLMPLLVGEGDFPERALFWHFPVYLQSDDGDLNDSHDSKFRTRPGSVIRKGKWKLHEYFEDGRLELYDLEEDTGERKNVANDHPELAAELHSLLKKWRVEIDAPIPTKLNPKYDPEAKDGGKKKK